MFIGIENGYVQLMLSRIKLCYYFDRLIDMLENDPQMKCFTFDGQTAALEDYLAIKPFQKERIARLVKAQKLFIGPWYVISQI